MNGITTEELMKRGLKLPGKRYEFYTDELSEYREELMGKGGVYHFYHDIEGTLYVGVSGNLWKRVSDHIKLRENGKKALQKGLSELEDVIVTVYMEPNLALRELYENYLILKYDPRYNVNKRNVDVEGMKRNDKRGVTEKEQESWIAEMGDRYNMAYLHLHKNVSLEELSEQFNETVPRIRYLISPWMDYEDDY